jgi:hypothetical protein
VSTVSDDVLDGAYHGGTTSPLPPGVFGRTGRAMVGSVATARQLGELAPTSAVTLSSTCIRVRGHSYSNARPTEKVSTSGSGPTAKRCSYWRASAAYILKDRLGDDVADRLLDERATH